MYKLDAIKHSFCRRRIWVPHKFQKLTFANAIIRGTPPETPKSRNAKVPKPYNSELSKLSKHQNSEFEKNY